MRQDNWIGRARAEQQLCKAVHMVTLTYAPEYEGGPDLLNASHMLPRDYQNWIRKLRSRGHDIRYIVTGEEGGIKGRVHWHFLLFWYTKPWNALLSHRDERGKLVPVHWYPQGHWANKRGLPEQDHWPNGHVVVEELNVTNSRKAISYVTKYMLKDQEEGRGAYFAASHNIGTRWLTEIWAHEVASQGKCPDSMRIYSTYSFPEDRIDPKGAWRYRMHSHQAAKFAAALEEHWHKRGHIPPRSKAHFHFLAKHDKLFFPDAEKVPYRPEPYRPQGPAPRRKQDYPTDLLYHLWDEERDEPRNVYFDDSRNTFYFDDPMTNHRHFWGPSSLEPGRYDWQRVIRSVSAVEKELLRQAQLEHRFGQPIGLSQSRQSDSETLQEHLQLETNSNVHLLFPNGPPLGQEDLPPLFN